MIGSVYSPMQSSNSAGPALLYLKAFLLCQTEPMWVCGPVWGLIFGAGVWQTDAPALIIMGGLSG